MKKIKKIILIVTVIVLAVSGAVYADELWGLGILNPEVSAEHEGDTIISPQDWFNVDVAKCEGTDLYADAEKLQVTYSAASEGNEYVLYVLKETETGTAPTTPDDTNIVYVEQQTASSTNLVFTVFQSSFEQNMKYYIFLAGSNDGASILDFTEIGTYSYYNSYISEAGSADEKQQEVEQEHKRAMFQWLRAHMNTRTTEETKNYDIHEDGYINEDDVEELRNITE